MKVKVVAVLAMFASAFASSAWAELPPDVAAKVEMMKKKLVEWAANPAVVGATKASNGSDGVIAGMTNSKWDELTDKDPQVMGFQTSAAGKLVVEWEQDKTIGKLYVRDQKGNLVASSATKPLLYNVATRPPFINAMKGAPWATGEIKPDPTTQAKSVQVSAPVMDGGKAIGVIHANISVE